MDTLPARVAGDGQGLKARQPLPDQPHGERQHDRAVALTNDFPQRCVQLQIGGVYMAARPRPAMSSAWLGALADAGCVDAGEARCLMSCGASGAVLKKILVSKDECRLPEMFYCPAQTAEAGHVHQLAGCAVWFAGVETGRPKPTTLTMVSANWRMVMSCPVPMLTKGPL